MNLRARLCLSTIDANAAALAREEGLALELAEFCTAANLDENLAEWLPIAEARLRLARGEVFHAPFAELYPAAIDPRARQLALDRLEQAYARMRALGLRRMVAHSGYVPRVYFPEWHVERSIGFWREFLAAKSEDFELLIENVLDDTPDLLRDILRGLNDPRAGACLDVGHAFVASEVTLNKWIEALRPFLRHVHLHDNDGAFDWHAPLGAGRIDIPAVLESLPETCTITLENMDAAPSLAWLKSHGYLPIREGGERCKDPI